MGIIPGIVETFDQALARLRAETDDEKDISHKGSKVSKTERGIRFEKLMLHYFKNDSIYKNEFKEVKLFHDWYREPDIGIDLVARDKDDKLVGIQCKCWNDDSSIHENQISNMFVVKESKKMDRLILVFTGAHVSRNIVKPFEESGYPILMKADLRQSRIDWSGMKRVVKPKTLQDHQKEAVQRVVTGLQGADRGKLIMACGTGKTITSLHIAETIPGKDGLVLYLVPSLSLIPQAMREWADNRSIIHQYMAVCSDSSASADEEGSITECPIPPSTDVETIKKQLHSMEKRKGMRVIFSTYNSVERIAQAMNGEFDLILFDEAHRTTGLDRIKESYYLMAHDNDKIPAKKRLYMTATPRIYKKAAKKQGAEKDLKVYSMDDVKIYGEELYRLDFSEAIQRNLLSSYGIIMREVSTSDIFGRFIKRGEHDENDYGNLDFDFTTKMGGVCKALTYPDGDESPPRPLQRVMVFHDRVKKSKLFAGHDLGEKVRKPLKLDKNTKKALQFDELTERLMETDPKLDGFKTSTKHVDGGTNSRDRGERINWLRDSVSDPKEIRILSNARCLQEGVDVPALDAVAFMDPKKSPIDIIQSIGRVMRKSRDGSKKKGYVIVPIPVMEGDNPKNTLNKNKKYEQISLVLNAILAHDNRLRNILNIQMLSKTSKSKKHRPADEQEITPQLQEWIKNTIEVDNNDELLQDIKTILLDMGDPGFYVDVGEKLGEQSIIIEMMLKERMKVQPDTKDIIHALHEDLQSVVGKTITIADTVKALAQHAVMARVFTALFPEHHNPVVSAFNGVLDKIDVRGQLESLEKYYVKIKYDLEQLSDTEQKQEFIRNIYDSFFRGADRKAADKHGIVYTPIEVVDFIISSVSHILRTEFGKTFDDRTVKVLDPFTGTGIFIAQLIERGMISDDALPDKYHNDIYANEIMLPAFYVAMSNIEASYQKMMGEYTPFDGISYIDTFAQHPSYRLDAEQRKKQIKITDDSLEEAMTRVKRQNMDCMSSRLPESYAQITLTVAISYA